jgi:hypothetical protein
MDAHTVVSPEHISQGRTAMSIFEFFSAPVGTPGNAVLNWDGRGARQILSYAWVYQRAAATVVAFHRRGPPVAIDESALPIVFLYRHALELYLKAIIFHAAVVTINDNELREALPRLWREHSLVRLLKMANPVLTDPANPFIQPGNSDIELSEVVRKIDGVDPGSYSFRYPVTSMGNAALPSTVFLNIFVLSETMELLFDDLGEFCRGLEGRGVHASQQMKLALHGIVTGT